MGICRYATLDKSVVQCLIRLLSGVRTYKSCIGGNSDWAVFMMATAEDLVVEGWSNTASQRNRPPT